MTVDRAGTKHTYHLSPTLTQVSRLSGETGKKRLPGALGWRRRKSRPGWRGATWGRPLIWLVLALLALCAFTACQPDPTPTVVATLTSTPIPPTETPTPTPTSTPTLTPTPTATPIPPVYLTIDFPRPVDALEPVHFQVLIEEPAGIDAQVSMRARVIDAQDQLYASFDMYPEGEGWWVPDAPLQLPLEPEPYPGVWHLIVDAQATLPIWGYTDRVFTPQRVPYHVLTDTLPSSVQLRVPQAFSQIAVQGDAWAGLYIWRYRDCEVTLAWAPGPTEPLFGDNALVMAEAIYPPEHEVIVTENQEITWGDQERTAFFFQESWRREDEEIPAETLVVQGPNYRLYALRVRAQKEREIHPLCRDVRDTLDFVEQE